MVKAHRVEMRLAYVWDCEECGRENFERAVVYELSPEEKKELEGAGEIPETGNWMSHPEHVTCKHCQSEFTAKHFRLDDDAMVEYDAE